MAHEGGPAGAAGGSIDDPVRLAVLLRAGLFNTPFEKSFDRLTCIATTLPNVYLALVSLVDRDRQFFKGQHGQPEPWVICRQTLLCHSFCQHVVTLGKPLVISDTRDHPLVRDNLAFWDLEVTAYAGFPLTTAEGRVAYHSGCRHIQGHQPGRPVEAQRIGPEDSVEEHPQP